MLSVPSHVSARWLVRANLSLLISRILWYWTSQMALLSAWGLCPAEQKQWTISAEWTFRPFPANWLPSSYLPRSHHWSHSCHPTPFPVLSESYGPTQGEIIRSSGLENLDWNLHCLTYQLFTLRHVYTFPWVLIFIIFIYLKKYLFYYLFIWLHFLAIYFFVLVVTCQL